MSRLSPDYAAAYPLLVDAELHHTPDNRFLLLVSGRVFLIGELLYRIIDQLRQGYSLADICAGYHPHGSDPLHLRETDIDLVLRKYLVPAGKNAPKVSSYLHTRFDLVGERGLQRLYTPLLWLFSPWLMGSMLLGCALLTTLFFRVWGVFLLGLASEKMVICTIVAYLAMVGGIFFHEVGHATAAARFGVAPKAIGFGFYLIFPVFYTDVTNVWKLDKRQRIIVNLAGVYFQLLFSVALIGMFYLVPAANDLGRTVTGTVLSMNVFVVLYSLNPFLRNDGYWVYSDFFEIPNLMSRSLLYPWRFFRLVAPDRGIPTSTSFARTLPLLGYSVGNYALFLYLAWLLAHYTSHSLLPRLVQLMHSSGFPHNLLTADNSFFLLKTFGLYGFLFYMSLYSLWRNYRGHRQQRARLAVLDQHAAAANAAVLLNTTTPLPAMKA